MSVTPVVMRRLLRELNELQTSPPEGIRVVTSEENILDVTGIIEGPDGTPYAGGYFKVKFKFTEEFPAAPPKCWFATKIFHPNVSSAGEICVNTLKKDWKSTYGIGHILVTVKCLLIYPNPESALDEEAGKLLLENYDDYCSRAKLITSVHATPKTRPTEFDTPSPAEESEEQSPTPSKASTSKSPTPDLTPLTSTTAAKSASLLPSPPSTSPLKVFPANLSTPGSATSLSVEKSIKQRLPSPSPLGTANSNVAPPVMAQTASKAVKRGATQGATGAEKRKKALKRL